VPDDYEAAAAHARAAMIERVRSFGASDATVAAMARVPRHRLLPHFWAMSTVLGLTEDTLEFHEGDVRGLEHVYDDDRPVAVNKVVGAVGGTTSTASAPRLLALQADLLALEQGMSVLEIGTGPGYFAALLAELVGPTGRVVTLDIDAPVVQHATARLSELGYAHVTAIARDGHLGAREHAPFDRVVGSVGCNDVSAAWLAQLAPGGYALVPLLHGAVHPMVRVDADGEGRVASRSGYVRIQGAQAGVDLWPHAGASVEPTEHEPLRAELARAVEIEPGRERYGGLAEWDLGYWVAAADQRAGLLASLNDGAGSTARIDAARGALTWAGRNGRTLGADLLDHAGAWMAAGRPAAGDHRQRFAPIAEVLVAAPNDWVIDRVDHRQVITPVSDEGVG
jgi:protein-L-isoaspartate(D-aspartate) O-methyltransferase